MEVEWGGNGTDAEGNVTETVLPFVAGEGDDSWDTVRDVIIVCLLVVIILVICAAVVWYWRKASQLPQGKWEAIEDPLLYEGRQVQLIDVTEDEPRKYIPEVVEPKVVEELPDPDPDLYPVSFEKDPPTPLATPAPAPAFPSQPAPLPTYTHPRLNPQTIYGSPRRLDAPPNPTSHTALQAHRRRHVRGLGHSGTPLRPYHPWQHC